ncbi:MAG TPA: TMEM43 family protein [Rariglobus sp.]
MSNDSFTEVSSQSWFSRIADSIKGILFGGVLFLIAFPILFWNEGRAVKTAKTINEGARAAVAITPDAVNPANEGKLVYLTGRAESRATLTDPVFGVAVPQAIKLLRRVEMYQWKESSQSKTEKNLGGSSTTETTYTYTKEWSGAPIASDRFKKSAEHVNPAALPYPSTTVAADTVTVGAFNLTAGQVARLAAASPVAITTLNALPAALSAKFKLGGEGFYMGADPANPQVGDVRVSFQVIGAEDVSLISQQAGNRFTPYVAKTGKTFDVLREGSFTLAGLIEQEKSSNSRLTWILRCVGLLLLFFGVRLILGPFAVLADVIPFLGDLVGAGLSLVALLVAASLGTVTIAVAWIVYRPLLGGALLIVAAGLAYLVRQRLVRRKPAPAVAA